MVSKLTAIFMVICCTFLTAYTSVIWKSIANLLPIEILLSWQLWVGFIMVGFAAGLLITALKYGDVTVLFPVVATSYIWITLLSNYHFDEPITIYKWISVVGIVLGITVLGKGSKVNK